MTDLFTYPAKPGAKERSGTSQAAADANVGRAARLRKAVLNALTDKPMTTDECAAELGENVLSIRPRFSELHEMGLVEKTGLRRKNRSGHAAVVWRKAVVRTARVAPQRTLNVSPDVIRDDLIAAIEDLLNTAAMTNEDARARAEIRALKAVRQARRA